MYKPNASNEMPDFKVPFPDIRKGRDALCDLHDSEPPHKCPITRRSQCAPNHQSIKNEKTMAEIDLVYVKDQ